MLRTAALRVAAAVLAVTIVLLAVDAPSAQPLPGSVNGCLDCHAGLPGPLGEPARLFEQDVHRDRGFGCVECHGGDPGAADQALAKGPASGYTGVDRAADACGTCHASFQARYEQSVHSLLFGCTECHGTHGVQSPADTMLGTTADAVCIICHEAGDRGFAVAAELRAGLDGLQAALQHAGARTGRLTQAGMEMSVQELALAEARSQLLLARTELHTFDPAVVSEALQPGLDRAARVEEDADAAFAELRFRRRGLALSLVAILILVIALGLKLRELDRRHGVRTGSG